MDHLKLIKTDDIVAYNPHPKQPLLNREIDDKTPETVRSGNVLGVVVALPGKNIYLPGNYTVQFEGEPQPVSIPLCLLKLVKSAPIAA
jgi:hypothetical protein